MNSRLAKSTRSNEPTARYIFSDMLQAANDLLDFTFSIINNVRLQNHFRERTRRAGDEEMDEKNDVCNFWFTFDYDIKALGKRIESACNRTKTNLKFLRVMRVRTPFDTLDIDMVTKTSVVDFSRKVKTLDAIVVRYEKAKERKKPLKKETADQIKDEAPIAEDKQREPDTQVSLSEETESVSFTEELGSDHHAEGEEETEQTADETLKNKSGNYKKRVRSKESLNNLFKSLKASKTSLSTKMPEHIKARMLADSRARRDLKNHKYDVNLTNDNVEALREICVSFLRISAVLNTAVNHISESNEVSDSMILVPTSSSVFDELRSILRLLRSLTKASSKPKPPCLSD